ncbi:MAG: protein translocase subunit SecD [Clostridia bacterium]|nr:protein translocase subunit SecD [Clostridia bacterium]
MKAKSIAKLSLAVIIIAFLAYIAAFGLTIGKFSIPKALDPSPDKGIRKGLDLAGGSVIVFEADTEGEVTAEDMDAVVAVMTSRLTTMGYTEAPVVKQGDRRVRIEIPEVNDPEKAIALLGATAKLTFVDAEGETVLEGVTDVKSAKAVYGPIDNAGNQGHYVQLELTSSGQTKFADATARISQRLDGGNFIAICLDDTVISAPRVAQTINDTTCVITGDFTAEEAKELAAQIQSGQLPFGLKQVNKQTVSAQLGADALNKSLMAGGIGLLLVMIFMIFRYRLCGFVADVSLVGYIAIVALVLTFTRANLTLPGIAGIIITIGTAVDANVIIFERIKEELGVGKTIRASVEAGFKRAFTAIIDSNITTLIAAGVLYYFGTGTIQGFAITLFIGTIVSMFTAIFVTKFLLKQTVGLNIRNPKVYCPVKGGNKNV